MSTLQVNTISESTSNSGVTVDGVLIKDGLVDGKDVSALTAGKILQVVNATDTTVASYTSTAGLGFKLGSLELSITPSATSSKLFLMTSLLISGDNRYWEMNFYRDSTRLGDAATATGSKRNIFHQAGIGDFTDIQYQMLPFQMHYLDSPSSTSAITYSVYAQNYSTPTIYYNRPINDTNAAYIHRARSLITAMEVGG